MSNKSLTENQIECLRNFGGSEKWSVPMDLGAWDASHHSNTLKRLAIMGLAERKNRYFELIHTSQEVKTGRRSKDGKVFRLNGPYSYRITDEGRAKLLGSEGGKND